MTRTKRKEMKKEVQEKSRNSDCTFCQLCVLVSELLPFVLLKEAVVAQAAGVRQTLHYCVQKTLSGRQSRR